MTPKTFAKFGKIIGNSSVFLCPILNKTLQKKFYYLKKYLLTFKQHYFVVLMSYASSFINSSFSEIC